MITGQRGVGKTQLAAAYARQRVSDGWLVAWIGAENKEGIEAGMVELGDRLSLYRPEDGSKLTAARVRNHLRTRPGRSLLVFDNAVSLDAVREYLPVAGETQMVITSTARGSQLEHRGVLVEAFDEEISLRFLRAATGIAHDAGAAELAREVGGLPLALAQAAARIRTSGWDYQTYLARFRQFPAENHLRRRDGDDHPLSAAKAVLIALEPFEDSAVLETLALLAPEGVSRELLGEETDDHLALLYESSLIEYADRSSVRTHRLVQKIIRDCRQAAGTYDAALERVAGVLEASLDKAPSLREYRLDFNEILAGHSAALVRNTIGRSDSRATAAVTRAVVSIHLWLTRRALQEELNLTEIVVTIRSEMSAGEVADAFERVFRRMRDALGATDPDTIKAAIALGRANDAAGRYQDVIAVLQEVHMAPGFGWNGGEASGEALRLYTHAERMLGAGHHDVRQD
ncbi:hypothetical protein [Lentzea sp. HUAS12]|uniref:hypothetical protein n=1 Tax=Lentzea sp. HUAS12 TaxID=2951806 RepID=UPI00209CE433|nr:hypothetical protein [Lentzea sp. HUAS12]USX51119.1 hypothetical protein ND450_38100 [Lentzea sp. HUAS12]